MVRVRFAPSPTGELHIGGARTALYNYLFARQHSGQFIIRLEDTDQERYVAGSLERLLAGLKWLGLDWDEGPDCGGPNAPYIQSQRLAIYQQYARELVKQGKAYYCFCSPQRLNDLRSQQQSAKQPSRYDRYCLKLSDQEIKTKLASHLPYVIRLLVPAGKTEFDDLIRGHLVIDNTTIDDQVLLKSDGYPTYHLANVVDDYLMQISHVIRGEEWLPSTCKHILLYQALAWQPPEFAHLPNVLNSHHVKLSKRRDGELVWLETYRQQGYLPAALTNFLALLGWHPSNDQELFSRDELIEKFDIKRVQKSGAVFDIEKLRWFNSTYLKALPLTDLDKILKPYYQKLSHQYGRPADNTINLTAVLQSRLVVLADALTEAVWYFKKELPVSAAMLIPPHTTKDKALAALQLAQTTLNNISDWQIKNIQTALTGAKSEAGLTNQEFLWPIRVALSGQLQSPDAFSLLSALGYKETAARLARAIELLK